MKKHYNFVKIAEEIEKKLKDPNLSIEEAFKLKEDLEYHRGSNFKINIYEKIGNDFRSNIFSSENYSFVSYLLFNFNGYDFNFKFKRSMNRKDSLIKEAEDFFKTVDEKHSSIISELIGHEYEHYYIKKDNNIRDHCLYSYYLNTPIVYINDVSSSLTLTKLIHEMQHQIGFMVNNNIKFTPFNEAASIFSELLAGEYMYDKTGDKEFLKIYLYRLKDISEICKNLTIYFDMLMHCGSTNDLDFKAAIKKFEINNKVLKKMNVASMFTYLLSFLLALSMKETFKNNKEKGLAFLYSVIDGSIMHNDMYLNDEYEKGIEISKAEYQKVMKALSN